MPIHRWRLAALVVAVVVAASAAEAQPATVAGKLVVQEKGGKPARDVDAAVIWLEVAGPLPARRAEISTEKKTFSPRVVVVPAGSTIAFPNHDPFNHNVFSLSEEGPFDLGLYGRNEVRTAAFPRPGVVRIYCNVHAQMSAVVVVRDGPYFTQPNVDGTFDLGPVPPGRHQLRAWHERGGELSRTVDVPAGGLRDLVLTLDASGFKHRPHLNKLGRPYGSEGRRY